MCFFIGAFCLQRSVLINKQNQQRYIYQQTHQENQNILVMQSQTKKLNAVLIGPSGAVGSTLLKLLLQSDKWDKIHCIARTMNEQWAHLHNKGKVYIHIIPDFDELMKTEEWKFEGFDVMFFCIGAQIEKGEEELIRVDKNYPLLCADIALKNKIPHFLYVSSVGSDAKSEMKYSKVKGQAEVELINKKMNLLTIIRPGMIKNRPHQNSFLRFSEILAYIPVIPSIECLDVGLALRGLAESQSQQAKKSEPTVIIYENKDLLQFLGKQE